MIYKHILHYAETTPDQTAIRRDGTDMSYREFADAIQLARTEFARRHLGGSGIIGVGIVEIQKFWISALALRSLGRTVLPIRAPEAISELVYSGLTTIVGNESWPELRRACHENHVSLSPLPSLSGTPSGDEGRPIEDGGHILLSSGTTGKPKMVLYNSRTDAELSKWLPPFDSTTMYHVLDYGPWTGAGYMIPVGVWASGGGIILTQKGRRYEALRQPDGTHIILLPAYLTETLAAPEDAFPPNARMKVYVGGGTVTAAEISDAKRRISPQLINAFGSTEVGGVAFTPLNHPDDQRWHCLLPNRGVQIVDEDDQLVPVGQTGRLRVAVGDGPSEYHQNPEATAAFFRDGYFYPGDLAVAREDGRIALQGRSTEIFNYKGWKIAPAQYEEQLREMLGFSGVCLLSAQDERGEEQIYIVIETLEPLSPQARATLHNFMEGVTPKIRTVAALPRTGTGKVIRRDVQSLVLSEAELAPPLN